MYFIIVQQFKEAQPPPPLFKMCVWRGSRGLNTAYLLVTVFMHTFQYIITNAVTQTPYIVASARMYCHQRKPLEKLGEEIGGGGGVVGAGWADLL